MCEEVKNLGLLALIANQDIFFFPTNTLINNVCCLNNQHSFGPMDYENLQQELALKETVWKKVSPESNEDISRTVVYRMEGRGEQN